MPQGRLSEVLAEAAQGETVSAANLNSPDQMVIAGHKGAVERAIELAKAAGARRAVLLPVSAPFHCALMRPAQQRMRAELDAITFRPLSVPLVNNWQAREILSAEEAREGLYQQIPNPVLWIDTVRRLSTSGVTVAVEVGTGAVLAGLIRQIDPSINTVGFGGSDVAADWEKLRGLI
jgi:[acyl-carrier-protein] S-malonyltransferase